MFRLATLIIRNVLRNRRRSILTLASTAISLALLALIIAMYQGFFYDEPASPSEALRLICRHREYLTELLGRKDESRDMVGTYMILADRPDNVPRIAKAIDAMFDNSPYPTRTESEKEFGRSFLAFLGNIKMFLAAICGAVTFTILLVSANTVAMAVRERTREMAILRTLGYTPAEILQLILGESIAISLLGGLAGLGLGWLLAKGMQAGGATFGFTGIKWQAATVVMGM